MTDGPVADSGKVTAGPAGRDVRQPEAEPQDPANDAQAAEEASIRGVRHRSGDQEHGGGAHQDLRSSAPSGGDDHEARTDESRRSGRLSAYQRRDRDELNRPSRLVRRSGRWWGENRDIPMGASVDIGD
ncbi:MAG: hypothetical protein WD007_00005, partial [Nitriliruptoraceae bacterium]